MSRKDMQNVALDWAEAASPASGDSPLTKFDYLKLRETLEAIVASMEAAARPTEEEPDGQLRLVVSNEEPESVESFALDGPQKPAA